MEGRQLDVLVLEPSPIVGGGSEAVVHAASTFLAGRGHRVHLLHSSPGALLEDYAQFSTSVIRAEVPLFGLRRPDKILHALRVLNAAVSTTQANVLFSSHIGYLPHASILRSRIPSLFHLGLAPDRFRWPIKNVHGVSPSAVGAQQWFDAGWPRSRIEVIPNWVDDTRFTAPAKPQRTKWRAELRIPETARLIVSVGRISLAKGTALLIDAWRLVAAECPDAWLLIAGPIDSAFEAELTALISSLTADARARLVLHPAVADPERLTGMADICCLPSTVETFGLSVIEAMACGKPVVALDIPVVRENLGAAGARGLVPYDAGAAGLAHVVTHALSYPDPAWGEALSKRASSLFAGVESLVGYEQALRKVAR